MFISERQMYLVLCCYLILAWSYCAKYGMCTILFYFPPLSLLPGLLLVAHYQLYESTAPSGISFTSCIGQRN